ncbi:MAG: chromate efflux transporter [Caldithrix sp.]|nr:chromate efflux transporter [Caldithrix sp.]
MNKSNNNEGISVREIAALFFKLGWIAFGGPAAHIAMMEEEVVNKRKWMNRQHFLDLVGATNLIPGPNSTEMAIHCGYHRGGFAGLVIAGISFIFPAVFITLILAWLYVGYGTLPAVEPLFYGIKPAVLAVILSAVYRLGKKALKGWQVGVIGLVVLAAALWGVSEITAILAGGLVGMIWLSLLHKFNNNDATFSVAPIYYGALWGKFKSAVVSSPIILSITTTTTQISGLLLFWEFLKVGAILFGSGYVLVAYLDAELVNRLAWLTRPELLDAIAIGQFTPGPVLSTSTFIGYQIQGFSGAILATLGIFLPSFLFVLLLNPIVPKLRKSKLTANFLDAVNVSAVAIMIAVVIKMGGQILIEWQAIVVAAISIVLVFGVKKLGSGWVIFIGALLGYGLSFIG